MTPLDSVFMLPMSARLNYTTIADILQKVRTTTDTYMHEYIQSFILCYIVIKYNLHVINIGLYKDAFILCCSK